MSKNKKIPGFEPDEASKALIESMFEKKDETPKEVKKKVPQKKIESKDSLNEKLPQKRHRIRIPEIPLKTQEEQAVALSYANDELELILDAFTEFSEKISETIIYGHLYQDFLRLSESFEDIEAMINDTILKEELTDNGIGSYEKMRKMRARILEIGRAHV